MALSKGGLLDGEVRDLPLPDATLFPIKPPPTLPSPSLVNVPAESLVEDDDGGEGDWRLESDLATGGMNLFAT